MRPWPDETERSNDGYATAGVLIADDMALSFRLASFGENYSRHRQLKAVYDLTNPFRMNANIAPA